VKPSGTKLYFSGLDLLAVKIYAELVDETGSGFNRKHALVESAPPQL